MWYLYFLTCVFGAIIGSFLNVVIYRLPLGNFLKEERSYCTHCKTQLKAYDLIPIISYIILGGKCRACGKKISIVYPIVEILTSLIALFSVLKFGFSLKAVCVFAVIAVFIPISAIDFKTMEIPHSLLIALIVPTLMSIFVINIDIFERVIGFFAVSVPMLILSLVIKSSFGGGDIKLIAICGFLLGWKNVLLAMFIAILIGGIYAIFLLLNKRRGHMPFAPYICIGSAVALCYGSDILVWYIRVFMYM